MTDGIIQQVFSKYIPPEMCNDDTLEILGEIQQELIEKIKNEVLGSHYILVQKLIGDNKE